MQLRWGGDSGVVPMPKLREVGNISRRERLARDLAAKSLRVARNFYRSGDSAKHLTPSYKTGYDLDDLAAFAIGRKPGGSLSRVEGHSPRRERASAILGRIAIRKDPSVRFDVSDDGIEFARGPKAPEYFHRQPYKGDLENDLARGKVYGYPKDALHKILRRRMRANVSGLWTGYDEPLLDIGPKHKLPESAAPILNMSLQETVDVVDSKLREVNFTQVGAGIKYGARRFWNEHAVRHPIRTAAKTLGAVALIPAPIPGASAAMFTQEAPDVLHAYRVGVRRATPITQRGAKLPLSPKAQARLEELRRKRAEQVQRSWRRHSDYLDAINESIIERGSLKESHGNWKKHKQENIK